MAGPSGPSLGCGNGNAGTLLQASVFVRDSGEVFVRWLAAVGISVTLIAVGLALGRLDSSLKEDASPPVRQDEENLEICIRRESELRSSCHEKVEPSLNERLDFLVTVLPSTEPQKVRLFATSEVDGTLAMSAETLSRSRTELSQAIVQTTPRSEYSIDPESLRLVTESRSKKLEYGRLFGKGVWIAPSDEPQRILFSTLIVSPRFSIVTEVRKGGSGAWQDTLVLTPGDRFEILLDFTNIGNVRLADVVIGVSLPPLIDYVPGSTLLATSINPEGAPANDNIAFGGVGIGHYSPSAGAFMKFEAEVGSDVPAGESHVRLEGVAQPSCCEGARHGVDLTLLAPGSGESAIQEGNFLLLQVMVAVLLALVAAAVVWWKVGPTWAIRIFPLASFLVAVATWLGARDTSALVISLVAPSLASWLATQMRRSRARSQR